MSAKDVIEEFELYLTTEKRYSTHTIEAYREDLLQFSAFAELSESADWMEVNHQLVRGWMVALLEQKITARSVSRKLSCLRSFFKWYCREKDLATNPMLKIRAPKVEKRLPQFVKQQEITSAHTDQLFPDNFDGLRDRLMMELFYQTGIRLSELLGLKESNVSGGHIKVLGKRNKERIIPLGPELSTLIAKYRIIKPSGPDSQHLLFVKRDGRKLTAKFVYRKINTYLGSVTNVKQKSPHTLRHTFATHMLNNGAGLETLKDLLGHASLSATQVYTHNSFAQINSIYSQAHPRGRKN